MPIIEVEQRPICYGSFFCPFLTPFWIYYVLPPDWTWEGADDYDGISLYTGGIITKQSSPVLMNPSKESYLCWLNWTFLPI